MTGRTEVQTTRDAFAPRGLVGPAVAAFMAVLMAVLTACSTSGVPEPSPSEPTEPEPMVSEPEPEPTSEPEPDPWGSLIATAGGGSVEVFDAQDSAQPALTVTAAEVVSYADVTPLTFLVLDGTDGTTADGAPTAAGEPRLQVLLPGPVDAEAAPGTRLDLRTGWVRERDVTVATTDYRIEVLLAEQRLLVHRAGDLVLDVPARLGPASPRPGRTFLTELVTPPAADGPYGVYAYGLAGYPTALAGFGTVAGMVGIHGGADPAAAGDPAADPDAGPGSVGLTDAEVTRLVEDLGLPLGTPVDVVA